MASREEMRRRVEELEKQLKPGCDRDVIKEIISLEHQLRDIEEREFAKDLTDACVAFLSKQGEAPDVKEIR